ncbi:hypothetical protein HDU93_001292 [Gonapodya sp. JEL0774]|nr:hypothetical protein HDU93_001292 [Gonapodya sp. JEL0774]
MCSNELTIVAACQNRPDHLRTSLGSWIRTTKPVGQIVIVDWSSEPGMRPVVEEVLAEWRNENPQTNHSVGEAFKQCAQRTNVILVEASRIVNAEVADGQRLPWILSWANNLALYVATMPLLSLSELAQGAIISTTDAPRAPLEESVILKLDCDVTVRADIFETLSALEKNQSYKASPDSHILPPFSFVSGNWRTAVTENDFHINGDFAARAADLHAVRGYDERIQTYGWDDSNLYERLKVLRSNDKRNGTRQLDFPAGSITHIQHTDYMRVSGQGGRRKITNVEFETLRNSLLSAAVPQWPGNITGSKFKLRTERVGSDYCKSNTCFVLQTLQAELVSHPPSLKDSVSEEQKRSIDLTAYGTTLRKYGFHLPLSYLDLPSPYLASLLRTFTIATEGIIPLNALASSPPRVAGILTIEVRHGLSNRLRALASAVSVAKAVGWHLRIVWVPDAHCGARFDELFEVGDLDVWNDSVDPLERNATQSFTHWYSYMDSDGGVRSRIDTTTGMDPSVRPLAKSQIYHVQHVHIRSAYLLNHTAGANFKEITGFLHSLVPVGPIREMIEQVKTELGNGPYVGMHIRALKPFDEFKGLLEEDYSEDNWRKLTEARLATSDVDSFAALLSNTSLPVFVTSDSPTAISQLAARVSPRVHWLDNGDCGNRSVQCVRYAVADMWILGGSSRIVGSWWSSFGEVAGYISDRRVEYVGSSL